MSKIIDLSYVIEDGMPVHPYDEKIKLYQDKTLKKDKYNNSRLEAGMHTGTHIDIARHLLDSDRLINELSVENFIGKGCLLDVRNESTITMKAEYFNLVKENDIVLIYTGFDKYFYTDDYFEKYPTIEKELAEFLISKKIKMIGMDLPSPDKYPFEIHNMFFEKDIPIIENMTNLNELGNIENFEVIALPLKIKAEASLVRAVARIL